MTKMAEQRKNSDRIKNVLVFFLMILAAGEFIWRGPVRSQGPLSEFNDLIMPYAAARAWLQGKAPYSSDDFQAAWANAGGRPITAPDPAWTRAVYPPSTLALLAPIAWLPWREANLVWLAIGTGITLLSIGMLAAQIPGGRMRWLFVAAALALAPLHTGLASGNVSIVAIGILVIGYVLALDGKEIASGVALGIATALKPQIGLWFLAYFLLRRRKLVVPALAVIAAVSLVAVGRLYLLSGLSWIGQLSSNYQVFTRVGSVNDFSSANPNRFNMLHIHILAFQLFQSQHAARVAAVCGLAGAALTMLSCWRKATGDQLANSAVAVCALLFVYHSFYDAALLVVPLHYAFAYVQSARLKALLALSLIPFAVPGGAIVMMAGRTHLVPARLVMSAVWQWFVLPHQTWALLVLLLTCLFLMRTCPSVDRSATQLAPAAQSAGLP